MDDLSPAATAAMDDLSPAATAAAVAAAAAAATPSSSASALPQGVMADDQDDSRSSSSTTSPAPADNEESDFFLGANDSQSSLGVPNFQDMQVDDACWPPVSRLPNEILISVFAKLGAPSDLYHCLLVSKRWARHAVDLLWHRPACTNWKNHQSICQTLGLEHPFFSYRDFIKRLNLAALADKVNDGSVQALAVCTRVERLTLTNCFNLTDSGVIALVENSASLLALDISNDKNITEQSVNAIAAHCRRLQGLNISGCNLVSNESMVNLARSCKYIKRLKLNECIQLRDAAILAFAEHCPNILEIDLHQCSHIGNGPITALLSKGTCLRELRLANCELIDDNAFLPLPTNKQYEHLRILDLTSCTHLTDAAVQKIIEVAPRLRNLVLAKCRNITDVAVNAISQLGKNLHYVHLGHCHQITDEGVKQLVHRCNRIRYIDLGCCLHLTDDSVKRLALLPKLKRIGLVKCGSITDDSVFTLAEAAYRPRIRRDASGLYIGGEYYASSLERVHLSYCVNLTLKSILRLLNSCPRLTHLSLTGVVAFQREEFQPYCRQAPSEFTQHQRDVFCVFSGSMVSKFRDFLNTSPLFEDARENLVRRPAGARTRPRQNPQVVFQAVEDEMIEDDEADEENFDPMEASDAGGSQPIPALPLEFRSDFAPGAPSPSTPTPGHDPTVPSVHAHPTHAQAYPHLAQDALQPLAYSSFLNNEAAHGGPSLGALSAFSAHAPASIARLGQQAQGNASMSMGASMASMHQASQQDTDNSADANDNN